LTFATSFKHFGYVIRSPALAARPSLILEPTIALAAYVSLACPSGYDRYMVVDANDGRVILEVDDFDDCPAYFGRDTQAQAVCPF
jgi:hypothetical protein